MSDRVIPSVTLRRKVRSVQANNSVPRVYLTGSSSRSSQTSPETPYTSRIGSGVALSASERLQGLYVIGASGTGKSTLLENLIIQDIEQGLGVCLIEPHGDITQAVLSRIPQRRERDIIYLDLMQADVPFGLNLFDCADINNVAEVEFTKSFVMHVFQKVLSAGEQTPQLNRLVRNITYTLIANPGSSFLEIQPLLLDRIVRGRLVANIRNQYVRQFWENYYDEMRPSDRLSFISSLLNRVDAFASSPLLHNVVGQSNTTIDFRRIMDEGKILLVRLPPRLEEEANLIGAVIIGKLLNAAYSRQDIPEADRRQFHIYADEFQRFAVKDFATFFTEARKYKIGLTVAHQFRGQLDDENRGATLTVANMVSFRVSPEDAAELAGRFDVTPEPAWVEKTRDASVEVVREQSVITERDESVETLEEGRVEVLQEERREVLEPEWRERIVDEIPDGTEMVRAVSQNPLDFLLNGSHESEEVREIVATFLTPLIKYRIEAVSRPERREPYRLGLEFFNNLLVYVIEGGEDFNPNTFAKKVAHILCLLYKPFMLDSLSYVFDFDKYLSCYYNDVYEYYVETDIFGVRHTARRFSHMEPVFMRTSLTREEFDNRNHIYISTFVLAYYNWMNGGDRRSAREHAASNLYPPPVIQAKNNINQHIMNTRLERDNAIDAYQGREGLEVHIQTLEMVVDSIVRLCIALKESPILVATGQERPRTRTQLTYVNHPEKVFQHARLVQQHPPKTIYHPRIERTIPQLVLQHPDEVIPHPQRTYQDMLNEVASALTRLPNFNARVMIGANEQPIVTDPPEPGLRGADFQQRKERVRERNLRQRYIQPRSEVERGIEERQNELKRRQQQRAQATSDDDE